MSRPASSLARATPADPDLDNLLDAFANKLQAGEQVDLEAYARQHPERAEELRRILPTMQVLAELERSSGTVDATLPASAPDARVMSGPLGDFHIIREIGRGGMGIVYEAEQLSLGRRVALKVLSLAAALDPRHLQRFMNEAQAAAHLHHNNIVPVFGVGCERGVHYYAMQLIEGRTLAAVIAEMRAWKGNVAGAMKHLAMDWCDTVFLLSSSSLLPSDFFRTVACWGMQAAQALAHAHDQGVMHRDIKPANLLLDSHGKVWITDFGLARFRDQAGMTLTGDFVGTLRYMSPEQALAKPSLIDHRTDVYSLGVTLYELLTLEPAFAAADHQELMRQIGFGEPRPPRRLNKALPAELENIVLKAMEKNPADRYSSAEELADDLGRFLEDKPIKARPPTLLHKARKWTWRHKPLVVTSLLASAIAVLTVAVVSTVAAFRIAAAGEKARTSAKDAQEKAEVLERENYIHSVALAYREWLGNNVGLAEQLLDRCPPELRGWEWSFCKRLCHLELHTFGQPGPRVVGLALGGQRLAAADEEGMLRVWDAGSGRVIFAVQAGSLNRRIDCHGNGLAISPDGERIAVCTTAGTVKVLSAATGQELLTSLHHPGVTCVAFSPDGSSLASGSVDGSAKLWDLDKGGRQAITLRGHKSQVFGVAFSPDRSRLATASGDGTLKLWSTNTGQEIQTLKGHEHIVYHVAFSPDGKRLASTSADSTAKVWDTATGREQLTLRGHTSFVRGVAFSPDGQRIATCAEDNTLKLWDARDGGELFTLRGHTNFVVVLAFSADGRRLASASHDGTVKLWDATQDHEPMTLGKQGEWIYGVAFSEDGKYLATDSISNQVRFWDATSGEALPSSRVQTRGIFKAMRGGREVLKEAFGNVVPSPKGDRSAICGDDGTIVLRDRATGRDIVRLRADPWYVHSTLFSPDGRWLASAGGDGGVRLWDATTGQLQPRAWHAWDIDQVDRHLLGTLSNGLAFSPDSKWIAAAGGSWNHGRVILWDVMTGQQSHTLEGHTLMVNSVAFSPDGRRLASGSNDGTIKLWDPETGEEVLTLRGHHSGVLCVAFSRDGHRIASGSIDHTAKIWDATPLDLGPSQVKRRRAAELNNLDRDGGPRPQR